MGEDELPGPGCEGPQFWCREPTLVIVLGLVLGGAALALAATTLLYLRRRSKQASVKEEPVQVGCDWSAALVPQKVPSEGS